MKLPFLKSRIVINVLLLSVLMVVEAVQMAIIVGLVTSFIPFHFTEFVNTLFLTHRRSIKPERELLIYHCSLVFGMAAHATAFFLLRKKLRQRELTQAIVPLLWTDLAWVIVQLFAIFKIFVYGDPWWARGLLYLFLGLSLLSRIFWPELRRVAGVFYARLPQMTILPLWKSIGAGIILMCTAIALIPNIDSALSRMFVYSRFHLIDRYLMQPTSGLSQIWSWIMHQRGQLNYEHALVVMVSLSLIYFLILFFFLKSFFRSLALAIAATLLTVKLQLFNLGISPIVWMYPLQTPVFYLFDVLAFVCLLGHVRTGRNVFLWLGACAFLCATLWFFEAGIALGIAFYTYVAITLVQPALRSIDIRQWQGIRSLVLLILLPIILLIIFYKALGIAHVSSWMGMPTISVDYVLKENYFFGFCMVFIIPCAYALTALWLLCRLRFNAITHTECLIIAICVYGLARHFLYLKLPILFGFYSNAWGIVVIGLFWGTQLLEKISLRKQILLRYGAVVLCAAALITNHFFTIYPNALNIAHLDLQQEKDFYHQSIAQK